MEVAAFHPSAVGRGLVSLALFVTSPCQGVTLHPALRSPDFPLCAAKTDATAAAWRLPDAIFYLQARRSMLSLCGAAVFLLPDVESARTPRTTCPRAPRDRHMHFLARRGTDLGRAARGELPVKTDLLHGAASASCSEASAPASRRGHRRLPAGRHAAATGRGADRRHRRRHSGGVDGKHGRCRRAQFRGSRLSTRTSSAARCCSWSTFPTAASSRSVR